jgi:hypothetical protein
MTTLMDDNLPDLLPLWKKAWRAAAPMMSDESLAALRGAVEGDDPKLIQGATSSPPPLQCVQDWPCEGACLLGYAGWKDGLNTVGEVEEYFARMCYEIDLAMGEPAGCRHLLNWYDETPRNEMRSQLLAEINLELQRRASL